MGPTSRSAWRSLGKSFSALSSPWLLDPDDTRHPKWIWICITKKYVMLEIWAIPKTACMRHSNTHVIFFWESEIAIVKDSIKRSIESTTFLFWCKMYCSGECSWIALEVILRENDNATTNHVFTPPNPCKPRVHYPFNPLNFDFLIAVRVDWRWHAF